MSKINHLKTIFTKKEQVLLQSTNSSIKEISKNQNQNERTKNNEPKKTNSLRTIIDTILINPIIQKATNIYNIMLNYNSLSEDSVKLSKKCYIEILQYLGGEPKQLKIEELLRSIMEKLPPNPNIETILDEHFRIKKIKNIKDKSSIIKYLSK